MRFYFTFILTILLGLTASAQGWEKTDPFEKELTSIISAHDIGYLIGGESKILKIDEAGEVIWSQLQRCKMMVPTNDNAYVVAAENGDFVQLTKIDISGEEIWNVLFIEPIKNTVNGLLAIDGGFLLSGYRETDHTLYVMRTDAIGNELWRKYYDGVQIGFSTVNGGHLTATSDGHFVTWGRIEETIDSIDVYRTALLKINEVGDTLWTKKIGVIEDHNPEHCKQVIATADGGYVVSGIERYAISEYGLILTKLDANGIFQWSTAIPEVQALSGLQFYRRIQYDGNALVETNNGDLLLSVVRNKSPGDLGETVIGHGLVKLTATGEVIWQKYYGQANHQVEAIHDLLVNDAGEILMVGNQNYRCHYAKADGLGNIYSNAICGNVYHDLAQDCLFDTVDAGLKHWMVEAEGTTNRYGLTDSIGNYNIDVDTGEYIVRLHPISPYWESCENDIAYDFSSSYDTLKLNFPSQATVDCPYLEVDISTPMLRRCFENIYTVNYCNFGTIGATDPWVEVEFDTYLTVNAASLPFTIENGLYLFEVEDLAVNECGSFTVNVTVDCDSTVLGQTHCVQAHIYPDSLCLTPDPTWSGANIELNAFCNNGFIEFIITNIGNGDMGNDLDYIVIEDDIIMYQGSEGALLAGASTTVVVPATGGTFRLEVDPIPGDPLEGMPSITVEGCTPDSSSNFSIGFLVNYAENDNNPFVSIDCQENIGSYDPNDKRGFPRGYGDQHFIEANTDIEYHIRFQNTGTDTAFTILIIDQLDPALDVGSLRRGASSHSYQLELSEEGLLKFKFENIMLPDSNVNEVASHGFVKFKIAQKKDNPVGTSINNEAAIYFDFNLPIFTNQTWHTIGEEYITVITSTEETPTTQAIKVYPNPFSNFTNFEWTGNNEPHQFRLYNLTGQLLREESFTGTQFQFYREDLTTGIYFYEISNKESMIGKGKMVVH